MITKTMGRIKRKSHYLSAAFAAGLMLFITLLRSRDVSREWSQPGFLQSSQDATVAASPRCCRTDSKMRGQMGLRGTPAASPDENKLMATAATENQNITFHVHANEAGIRDLASRNYLYLLSCKVEGRLVAAPSYF